MAEACALEWAPGSLYNTAISTIVTHYAKYWRHVKGLPENVQFDVYYKVIIYDVNEGFFFGGGNWVVTKKDTQGTDCLMRLTTPDFCPPFASLNNLLLKCGYLSFMVI